MKLLIMQPLPVPRYLIPLRPKYPFSPSICGIQLLQVLKFHLLILKVKLLTYLLTYELTPWSRILLEKLTGSQLVKKFPALYGNRRFITTFTSACHLPLS